MLPPLLPTEHELFGSAKQSPPESPPAGGASKAGGQRRRLHDRGADGDSLSRSATRLPPSGGRRGEGVRGVEGGRVTTPFSHVWWARGWHARLECWYHSLSMPTRAQLSGCAGALALHVGSALDAAWRAAGRGAHVARSAATAESGCEWLGAPGALSLPELPTVPQFPPDDGRFTPFVLPPIPRLLLAPFLAPSGSEWAPQATAGGGVAEVAVRSTGRAWLGGGIAVGAALAVAMGAVLDTIWHRRGWRVKVASRRGSDY